MLDSSVKEMQAPIIERQSAEFSFGKETACAQETTRDKTTHYVIQKDTGIWVWAKYYYCQKINKCLT